MFQSIGHRAWHAYYCLPRNEKGEPPAYRALEDANDLSNAAVQKMVRGKLKRPGFEVLTKIANALNTTPQWLQTGEGALPTSGWPIPPYPYGESASLSDEAKASFERDAKKLANGSLARRAKSARK